MTPRIPLFLLIASFALAPRAQEAQTKSPESSYHDHDYGFTLTPPAFESDDDAKVVTIAQFLAPAADGFAANLGLQRQKFAGGFEAFVKTSDAQFEQMDFKVLSKHGAKIGSHASNEWVYTGTLGGNAMKFHALAVEQGEYVFLLTGTALEQNFDDYEPQFKAALASFRFDK